MDFKAFAEELSRLVRPQSHPLGVKLVKDPEALPQGAVRPSKYGIKISLCQWITMARRWGRQVGAVAEDINCTPCLAALGLKQMPDAQALAAYFMEMGYFSTMALAEKALQKLDPLPAGEIGGVAFFPLAAAPIDPDLVVIYGSPAQMARMAAGWVYHHGEPVESRTTGFGISCLAALKPYVTGQPALVHPGRGERILAGTDDAEMLLTLPANGCEAFLDGLRQTQDRGTRYPVQSYMLYQPPDLKPMQNLGAKLAHVVGDREGHQE